MSNKETADHLLLRFYRAFGIILSNNESCSREFKLNSKIPKRLLLEMREGIVTLLIIKTLIGLFRCLKNLVSNLKDSLINRNLSFFPFNFFSF